MSEETERKPGGISIHAVDVANGVPGAGLEVHLWRIDGNRIEIASGTCEETGLLKHPVAEGVGVIRGLYEVEFGVGRYYQNRGVTEPDPSFVDIAIFRFGIDKVHEHFHLPFKFTPWGFSLFRGGA